MKKNETPKSDGADSSEPTDRWSSLGTEQRHSASRDLDKKTSREVVALLLEEDRRGLERALEHRDGHHVACHLHGAPR